MRFALLALICFRLSYAQSPEVRLVRVASGFASITEITSAPGGNGRDLYVVEQRGRIRILRDGSILATSFLDISGRISCCGERGLLGLAFSPTYASKSNFYIYYTDPQGTVVVSRFRVSSNRDVADSASEEVLYRIPHPQTNHNGGRLVFGPDGYLYIGHGDGGGAGDPQGNGQNLNTMLGKILRIDPESGSSPYGVPVSNPFVGRSGVRPEIWAWGLRNPWKFSFDPQTKDLFIADVGQDRAEEIDFQPASSKGGENYGWNRTEGTGCYPPNSSCTWDGITRPVLEYPHSLGISVTGGYVYRGSAIPALQGDYLYGDYGSGRLWAVRNTASGWQNRELLSSTGLQISTFGQDLAGELYIGDYQSGGLYRVTAASPNLSIVNAASFSTGIVPGSLATIFGSGIAPVVGIVSASSFPLPLDLAGVSVTMNGTRVPVLAVANVNSQDQINIQVPWELQSSARASVIVTVNGQATTLADVPIAGAQPEIFTVQQQPAAWTIWLTGAGAVSNSPASGQPAPSNPLARTIAETRVTVGGMSAQVLYSGLSPSFAGLYQVNIVPPANVDPNADVVVSVGSAVSRPWRASAK